MNRKSCIPRRRDVVGSLAGDPKPADNRQQIEESRPGIKSLARQLNITIVTLSQLNREVEKRTGARPMLSDLEGVRRH